MSKNIIVFIVLGFMTVLSCKKPVKEKQQKPNILLICIDDLRPELNTYGATHIHSPNIDNLAASGVQFNRHYVNAPSCGPSRFTLLTGVFGPQDNSALFKRAEKFNKDPNSVKPSMPEWFRKHGYTTVSVGKVSHHPGGRGGKLWNDSTKIEIPNAWDKHLMPVGEWETPVGTMHGLAHGEVRKKANEMAIFQSAVGTDMIYPDGLITKEGLKQLKTLASDNSKPFFLAIGLIKPHLPFGAPKKYMDLYDGIEFPEIQHPDKPEGITTWHKSGEFMKYNRWEKDPNEDNTFAQEIIKHYAACVSYADKHVGDILNQLKQIGADKNTIVILWGDHGWHLGEHAIWGKHSLFEESLHSPLIISYPNMDKSDSKTDAIVSTVDIFPTLCDLTGIETPDFVKGETLKPFIENPNKSGHAAIAYRANNHTIRTDTHRMTLHKNGFVELYDHTSKEKETKNVAEEKPELVEALKALIEEKIKPAH
ncbi:sulfatase [Seonamhaeicola maritimus]|uniref:Sulfatase n=1 Tax=Seonamhaeicola maritimus TaxID=2591822 RepID=A0A5C7GIH1_9FLAO|nr:sulfatase [Seonamhaeicola maritimus]TXG37352.1 sulfatase [Seonamhaeicola maritimus]